MLGSPPEKRVDGRVPLLLRIDYPGAPGFRDATENLSAGGLFIRTSRGLEPGVRVPLLVSFPGLLEPLRIGVEVVWRRDEEGQPQGVAVKIPDDGGDDRLALSRLVESATSRGPASRTYRILLVEDNPQVETMYEHALAKLRSPDGRIDVSIDYARDGVEALARLQRHPRVELVLTDLFMPVMDGFTLVEHIRADPDLMATPVLAISAGGADARERAIELGVDVYLQKPVKIAEILGTVRTLLRIVE
ncbi:MAG TPA: response regulator [Anaeromyxobacteraceae bacterium]